MPRSSRRRLRPDVRSWLRPRPWPVVGLSGLLLAAGVAWAGGGATGSGSLAPLDVEAFRLLYGQEALFRLRLGVDAARAAGLQQAVDCRPGPPIWDGSADQLRYDQKLKASQPYAAGQILGGWQLRQERCATGRITPP